MRQLTRPQTLDLVAATDEAAKRLDGIALRTPLQASKRLSREFGANVLIKREDMQEVRSFKVSWLGCAFATVTAATHQLRIS